MVHNFNYIKSSKFLKRVAIAILSLFAISAIPAEAAAPKKHKPTIRQHHRAASKKVAPKPVVKHLGPKVAPKKVAAKPVVKRPIPKVVPKKAAAKSAVKSPGPKVGPKKAAAKPVVKRPVPKVSPKKVAPKPVVKRPVPKIAHKVVGKTPTPAARPKSPTPAEKVHQQQAAKLAVAKKGAAQNLQRTKSQAAQSRLQRAAVLKKENLKTRALEEKKKVLEQIQKDFRQQDNARRAELEKLAVNLRAYSQALKPLEEKIRQATQLGAKPEFLHRAFVKVPGKRLKNDSRDLNVVAGEVPYVRCDLGYGNQVRARTQQYKALYLPTAPVLHPYGPAMPFAMKGYVAAAFTLNVKFPGYNPAFGPEALHRNLANVRPENIDMFLIVQDAPWYDDVRPGPEDDALRMAEPELIGQTRRFLQLKPQYWLEPNAPYDTAGPYGGDKHRYTVQAGVFSKRPNVRIQGQPNNGLVLEPNISIHNSPRPIGVDGNGNIEWVGTNLVSSSNVLSIENLDLNTSQVLYSLTKYVDKITGVARAAIVKHVLLNPEDERTFEQLLFAANTLEELKNHLIIHKTNSGRFATIDPDEMLF